MTAYELRMAGRVRAAVVGLRDEIAATRLRLEELEHELRDEQAMCPHPPGDRHTEYDPSGNGDHQTECRNCGAIV